MFSILTPALRGRHYPVLQMRKLGPGREKVLPRSQQSQNQTQPCLVLRPALSQAGPSHTYTLGSAGKRGLSEAVPVATSRVEARKGIPQAFSRTPAGTGSSPLSKHPFLLPAAPLALTPLQPSPDWQVWGRGSTFLISSLVMPHKWKGPLGLLCNMGCQDRSPP